MNLAIYGKCCTGKTVVSDLLAQQLGLPVRHCGELVKEAAIRAGTSPGELSSSCHRRIDAETREVVIESSSGLLVEGTFLDHVLVGVGNCNFIKLTCSSAERAKRLASRGTIYSIEERDDGDQRLCIDLFADANAAIPSVEVDTTNLTPSETARCIMDRLNHPNS
jgi:cytidylate kinase